MHSFCLLKNLMMVWVQNAGSCKEMNASAIVLSHERKERWCSSLKVEVLLHSYDGIFTPIFFYDWS